MATWTNTSKSSPTWTNTSKSGQSVSYSIVAGNPIGLLLSLTYASSVSGTSPSIVWTNDTKH